MPNWIQTNYVISGDAEQIAELKKTFDENKDCCEEVALSDVVEHFDGDSNKIPCRGYIAEYGLLNPGSLSIITFTAYHPILEVWNFVKSKLPSISYQYTEIP